MTEQQLRDEMVQIGTSLLSRGYAAGSTGNLSLLSPDGNLLATLTGSCFGKLQAQRLPVVTLQGEWFSGDKPSKEAIFHQAVYLHNPACKTIVHLHSHYLTMLSYLQGLDPHNCTRPFTLYVVMCVGDVSVVPHYRPGDDRVARALAGPALRYNAFLPANYGPVVTGSSLCEATNNTEELEEAARLIFTFGNRKTHYLTADEVDELR